MDWINIYMGSLLSMCFIFFLWHMRNSKNLGPATYYQQEENNRLLKENKLAIGELRVEKMKSNDLMEKILKELQRNNTN